MKKNRISIKLAIIILMTLGLMIPSFLIQNLVEERSRTNKKTAFEIGEKWGAEQLIVSPVMAFTKGEYNLSGKEKPSDESFLLFYPETNKIHSECKPFVKKRGIFKTVVYETTVEIEVNFDLNKISSVHYPNCWIDKNNVRILLRISDLKGISDYPRLLTKDSIYQFTNCNETDSRDVLQTSIPIHKYISQNSKNFTFKVCFKLKGNEELLFAPSGLKNTAQLISHWNTVSYVGDNLPDNHTEKKNLAVANWSTINNQARSNQLIQYGDMSVFNRSYYPTLGANYIIAVDHYMQVMRSTKYALMFIVLTFTVFFFIEILSKRRIHPIQYLLVSIALLLFYTLLLSLSEQIGFAFSYLISSLAIVGMISLYTKAILKSGKHTLFTALMLSALYGFLFILLQLESYALMAGSIGLFIILAVLMYISSKIDWYGEEN